MPELKPFFGVYDKNDASVVNKIASRFGLKSENVELIPAGNGIFAIFDALYMQRWCASDRSIRADGFIQVDSYESLSGFLQKYCISDKTINAYVEDRYIRNLDLHPDIFRF